MVYVPVILRTDDDRVAFLQFVDIAEGLSVAIAVACEGEVADLAGHLRVFVVAEAVFVEFGEGGSLNKVALPLAAESRNVDLGDQLAFLRALRLRWRIAFLRLRDGDVVGLSRVGP